MCILCQKLVRTGYTVNAVYLRAQLSALDVATLKCDLLLNQSDWRLPIKPIRLAPHQLELERQLRPS